MKTGIRILFLNIVFFAGFISLGHADEWHTLETQPKLSIGIGVWHSSGGSEWNHDASQFDPALGDPTSRLKYDDVDASILELKFRAQISEKFLVDFAYGTGDTDNGTLTDQDFLSEDGASFFGTTVQGEHAFSETVSDMNGDTIQYFDIKLTRKLFQKKNNSKDLGVFARYLNWTEKYRARGFTQTTCTAPNLLCLPRGFSGFNDQDVILNEANWQGLFLGLDGKKTVNENFSMSASLAYTPLFKLKNDDRHFLRRDLAQSPSFRMEGYGNAVLAEVNANYRFTPRLSASLGLRYWWAEVKNKSRGFTIFPVRGNSLSTKLNNFESQRMGITLGISYALGILSPREKQ